MRARGTKALAEKGDYYFIQFGHNDQKKNIPSLDTDPETTFAAIICSGTSRMCRRLARCRCW